MKMALRIDSEKIRSDWKERIQDLNRVIVETMQKAGEDGVSHAREYGNYNDITGNLRSSVGYGIFLDGSLVEQSAGRAYSGPKGDGTQGVYQGQTFLEELNGSFPKGKYLVMTAGMPYARYVEDVRGRDVVSSAALKSGDQVMEILESLNVIESN